MKYTKLFSTFHYVGLKYLAYLICSKFIHTQKISWFQGLFSPRPEKALGTRLGRRKLDKSGEGSYSYIRIHRP